MEIIFTDDSATSNMILLQEPHISETVQCPYLDDRLCRFRHFFARGLSAHELEQLLSTGWRKFGIYYFKPECPSCRSCIPVRVRAREFISTKSQRRVTRKNLAVESKFRTLDNRDEIYDIYRDHSLGRFGKVTDREDFDATFYLESCPTMQSEYSLNGELFAIGFLDRSSEALSSIYFAYRTAYSALSPGTLSVLREIEFAKKLDLNYYYLGYYIAENKSMSYKNKFHPCELFNWNAGRWIPEGDHYDHRAGGS